MFVSFHRCWILGTPDWNHLRENRLSPQDRRPTYLILYLLSKNIQRGVRLERKKERRNVPSSIQKCEWVERIQKSSYSYYVREFLQYCTFSIIFELEGI